MTQQGTVQSPEILIHFAAPTFSKGFEGGNSKKSLRAFFLESQHIRTPILAKCLTTKSPSHYFDL